MIPKIREPHIRPGKVIVTAMVVAALSRAAFRFLTGRPMLGDSARKTDATLLRPGTRALHPDARPPGRWSYLPEWQRAVVRMVVATELVLAAHSWWAGSWLTGTAAATAAATALGVGAWRVRAVLAGWRHRRTYVLPLHRALQATVGVAHTAPERWLIVPRNFRCPDYSTDPDDDPEFDTDGPPDTTGLDGEVVVRLPQSASPTVAQQRQITRTVASKLGIDGDELVARWLLAGSAPQARFRRHPQPPGRVTWPDIAAAVHGSGDGAPVLGLAARGRVVTVDLDHDSPHVGVSCGSGAGKSVLLRTVIAQLLYRGTQVIVCDKKRTSQRWCKDLPGVTYCRTAAEIHDAILTVAAEVDRRAAIVDTVPAEDESTPDVGPRIALIFEEQNIGMRALVGHWKQIRQPGEPARSPAVDALDHILCAGREFRVHVVSVAQLFTVQATGGDPAARANYGIRILARATKRAWDMLAPEVGPRYPRKSRVTGRMHMVLADRATEVQVAFLTTTEARSLAAAAPVTVPATWTTTSDQERDASHPESVTRRYTLAEASREGVVPLKPGAMRMAKMRAGDGWPPGQLRGSRETWSADELRDALARDATLDTEDAS